jgi:hypothetical protein
MRKEIVRFSYCPSEAKTKRFQHDGQIENLIPVLMLNRDIGCNMAMQQSYALALDEAMGLRNFDLNPYKTSHEMPKAVSQAFIRGCQDVAMGLAHWRYASPPPPTFDNVY